MTVPYEYYKVFYYVARYQSINKAAKVLSNSQPNITRTISRLETMLDCKLFVRSSKGVTLTEQGEALYGYVKAAHKLVKLAEAMIESFHNPDSGSIVLGLSKGITSNSFLNIILPAI